VSLAALAGMTRAELAARVLEARAVGVDDERLVGKVEYTQRFDGAARCDLEVSLKGTPYTGDCEGCDFAFDITDAELSRDDSTSGCGYEPAYTFIPWSTSLSFQVAWAPTWASTRYSYYYYYTPRTYYDAFLVGYTYDWGSYYGYDYSYTRWVVRSHRDSTGTTTASAGLDWLEWAVDLSDTYTEWRSSLWGYCGGYYWDAYASRGYAEADADAGTLPCDWTVADTWTFEAEAGEELLVSVDTLSGSYFSPALYVTDPETCIEAVSYGAYRCSSGGGYCPSVRYEAGSTGTHTVIVMNSDCAGESEYVVDVRKPR
jgi:hypothetical protein